jgi:hypothetical protein
MQSATCRTRLTNACIHCEKLRSHGAVLSAAWHAPTYIYPRQCGAQRRESKIPNERTHTHTCKYIPQTFMHKYIQSNMHACPMKGTRRYLNMGLAKNTKAARSRHSRLAGVFELFECKMLYRSLTQMDAAILDRGMNASHVTCACVLTYKVLKCETRSAAGWIRRSAQATICFCCSCARLRHGRARCL